jgi:hypothetical protein
MMTPDNSPTRLVVHVEEGPDAGVDPAARPQDVTEAIDVSDEPASKPRRRARRHLLRQLVGRSGAGVWVGLVVAAAGFGLIAFTWSKTAALVDVSQQVPYLVSGGLVGLGLILVGLLVVNLSVKRREAQNRGRQLEEVRDALVHLRASIEGVEEDES